MDVSQVSDHLRHRHPHQVTLPVELGRLNLNSFEDSGATTGPASASASASAAAAAAAAAAASAASVRSSMNIARSRHLGESSSPSFHRATPPPLMTRAGGLSRQPA